MAETYYHKNHVPVKDELIMARIISITDLGVTCALLEYNNLKAFLPFSEISRKNIRSIYNCVKVGQKQVFQVTTVDKTNVDLSKKFLNEHEVKSGEEKYKKSKSVYNICNYLSESHKVSVQLLYEMLVYPLYDEYDYPYDAFKLLLTGINIYENYEVNDDYVDSLVTLLKQQITIHPVKIAALVDITCFNGGVNVIKTALLAAKANVINDFGVKIKFHSSPTFLISVVTTDQENGIIAVDNMISCIKEEIIKRDGNFVLKKKTYVLV